MPKEPRPAQPGAARAICARWRSSTSRFQHQSASSPAVSDISFDVGARRDDRVRRAVGRRQDDAGEAAGRPLPAAVGRHPLQRHRRHRHRPRRAARAHRLRHPGHAALLRHDPREPAVRESVGDRRRVPRRAAQGGLRQPAGARRPRPRHGDRRRRRQGVGRREAAAVDRARAAAAAAPAGVRRGDLVARLADRGRIVDTIRDVATERRRDHRADRAPAVDDPARRSHLRARARPHRRDRAPRRAASSRRGSTTRCGGSRSASAVSVRPE